MVESLLLWYGYLLLYYVERGDHELGPHPVIFAPLTGLL